MNAKATLLNNPVKLFDSRLARVAHLASAANIKAASDDRENECLKSKCKVVIECAIDEDVASWIGGQRLVGRLRAIIFHCAVSLRQTKVGTLRHRPLGKRRARSSFRILRSAAAKHLRGSFRRFAKRLLGFHRGTYILPREHRLAQSYPLAGFLFSFCRWLLAEC